MTLREFCYQPNIVFDDRNKSYGAYILRQIYEKHILMALLVGATVFGLAISSPLIYDLIKGEPVIEEIPQEVIIDLKNLPEPPKEDIKTPPPPPEAALPPPPKVSTIKFVEPEVTPDDQVTELPPKQEDFKNAQAGAETVEGDPNASIDDVVTPPGNGTGALAAAPAEEEIFTIVEQQPSFPGGDEAMFKFLQKNIKYPSSAVRNELQGVIYLNFTVNTDGEIVDIRVLKGLSTDCDNEAIRVVKMMPPWKPGKQGGKAVRVKFTLPVRFTLGG